MLHPALRRALATAHIEDLHRAAMQARVLDMARNGRATGGAGLLQALEQRIRRQTIRLQQGGLKPRESQAGVRRK